MPNKSLEVNAQWNLTPLFRQVEDVFGDEYIINVMYIVAISETPHKVETSNSYIDANKPAYKVSMADGCYLELARESFERLLNYIKGKNGYLAASKK